MQQENQGKTDDSAYGPCMGIQVNIALFRSFRLFRLFRLFLIATFRSTSGRGKKSEDSYSTRLQADIEPVVGMMPSIICSFCTETLDSWDSYLENYPILSKLPDKFILFLY